MTPSAGPPLGPGRDLRSRLTLLLFMLIVTLLHADQNLLAPSLTAVGHEFGFTRAQIDQRLGADVNLTFWMLGGVITLVVGYVADRATVSRKWLLVGVTLLGQGACLLSGFARTYEELYWARALTGIGMGGSFPLVYSLLGDYAPPERRAKVAAQIALATGLGVAGGQLVAGLLTEAHGWRLPFLVIGLPGMGLSLLFALVAREPRRGGQEAALQRYLAEGHSYEERLRLSDVPRLLGVRTNLGVLLQALPGTVPWGVFFVYLNDFYSHDKGFTVADATLLVMRIGAAAIVGSFLGGLIGQRAHRVHPKYLPLVCAVTTMLAVLPMAVLISYPVRPGTGMLGPSIAGVLTGFLAAVTGPNIYAMLLNVNPPERRGAAFSLLNLCNDLGRGFGAWIVGGMAARLGRVSAFHIANLLWLLCGLVLLALYWIYPREEAELQQRLRAIADARLRGQDPTPDAPDAPDSPAQNT